MITRALTLALLCTTLATAGVSQPATPRGAETRLFAMQSNFWVNLHHFLYVSARARRGMDTDRVTVTRALADTMGLGTLSPSTRAEWDQVLDYYSRALAQRDVLFDSALVHVNVNLSRVAPNASPRTAALDAEHGRMLERAAPAYRTVWWPRHDASNRRWIAAVTPLLRQHGDSAAAWETRAFAVRWPDTPVPVDVSAYTNWSGAYTTADPDHVTISSEAADIQGTAAFELLFHEVLHTMDRPLFERYRSAARALGKRMLRNPTHPFVFYTAGEVTRRLFPGHVPYAEQGLWQRSQDMGPMRPLLQRHWQLWLDGQISLDEALRRIAADL